MRINNPNSGDKPLTDLLRTWKVEVSLPPRFQEEVWQRIERREHRAAPSVSIFSVVNHWVETWLPRPAMAVAYVTILLLIGLGAGWTQAQRETAQTGEELSLRYVHTVDPYQSSR